LVAHPGDRVLPAALHRLHGAGVRIVTGRDHVFEVTILRLNDLVGPIAAELVITGAAQLLARHGLHWLTAPFASFVISASSVVSAWALPLCSEQNSRNESDTIIIVPGSVKKNVQHDRPTTGGRGQARTRLARGAVVAAARDLFLDRGYAATTIDAISNLADVPPATVYRLFTSKLGILKALLDTSIGGDDQALAEHDRPEVADLLTGADPTRLLAGCAGVTAAINQRSNDVYRVLVSAAASDIAAAQLLAEIQRQRDRGQGDLARALARKGALRTGLKGIDAADLIHALMSPEVYRLLVIERHWTLEHYQHWLATTLTQQLVGTTELASRP